MSNFIGKHSLTVGYNLTGQEFFDLLMSYRPYIQEFYFALTHTMPRGDLNPDEVKNTFKNVNTYNIPGNYLLNHEYLSPRYEELIEQAKELCNLQSVTLADLNLIEKVHKKYPKLKIHISTHSAYLLDINQLDNTIIDTVNITEPLLFKQKDLINKCIELGIKIKLITNRGCLMGSANNIIPLIKHTNSNIDINTVCDVPCPMPCTRINLPYIKMMNCNLYKEQSLIFKPTYYKLSTREQPNNIIDNMLQYWISNARTKRVGDIIIENDNQYNIFIQWLKIKWDNCIGNCLKCDICKDYYYKLVN